jgi:hypothetical protein
MSADHQNHIESTQTVNRLIDILEARERRHRHALTLHRILLAGLLLLILGLLGQGHLSVPGAFAQAAAQERVAGRPQLTPGMRAQLREFDKELALIKAAIAESEEFEYGAMIAWFLYKLADSMEYVPQMNTEMQRMNQNMTAVPVMAAEMRQLNNNMAIMTHGVDRTMGNMGRMMPFMW